LARPWVDPDDVVGVPDVCPHLALDELELVQPLKRPPVPGDGEPARGSESLGIEVCQDVAAVAQDKARAVIGEPPSLALVTEFTKQPERREVVHEAAAGLPAQLHESVADAGEALAEHVGRKLHLARHLPAGPFDPAERRPAEQPRALEESAVVPEKA